MLTLFLLALIPALALICWVLGFRAGYRHGYARAKVVMAARARAWPQTTPPTGLGLPWVRPTVYRGRRHDNGH